MQGSYAYVLIKTYYNMEEHSPRPVRANPLPGQGLDTGMHVECCTTMRACERVGSILKIKAKLKLNKSVWHLYSRYGWAYEVFTPEEAKDYLKHHGEDLQEWAARYLPAHLIR